MKNYEGIFILRAKSEEEAKKAAEFITSAITKNKGSINAEENWGKKEACYPIKKEKEGVYLKVDFSIDPSALKKIESACGLNQDVLRSMIVKSEK